MTHDMAHTEYEGFPVQMGRELVMRLNTAYDRGGLSNSTLQEAGSAVSDESKHFLHGDTPDGYGWFGRLHIPRGNGQVAILFPWAQDWGDPESQMDRSINIYTDGKVSRDDVSQLVEELALQLTLATRQKGKQPSYYLVPEKLNY